MAKNGTPTPPWWTLGAVLLGVFFAGALVFNGLFSNSDVVAEAPGQVPDFVVSPGLNPQEIPASPEALPTDEPTPGDPSAEPTPSASPSMTLDPPQTTPEGQFVFTRDNMVLSAPLSVDSFVTTLDNSMGRQIVPTNALATATAAMWAGVDKKVAAALPVMQEEVRPTPKRTFKNAKVTNVRLVSQGPLSYTFIGLVDPDGSGPDLAKEVTHTVVQTSEGYKVQS